MINNKEIIKEYFTDQDKKKERVIEHFKLWGWVESTLSYFPFFIYYPIKGFIFLIYKSFSNPIYIIVMFILFAVIRKVVRSNTYEWAWAYKTSDE